MNRKTPHRTAIVLLASAVLLVIAAACSIGGDSTVVLEVTGPASADITYGIGVGQTQNLGAALPWKKELTSKDDPLILVVVAQSKATGEIACKISVDGKVVKENKSSGEFAVVTCSNG